MFHRLEFADFDPALDGWADIHRTRTYGTRLDVNEAAAKGIRAYGLARMARYVANWSLAPGSPADEAFVAAQDDDLMTWILNQAEAHYEGVRRSRAERKRDRAGAPGELRPDGDRPRDHLAPGEPTAA